MNNVFSNLYGAFKRKLKRKFNKPEGVVWNRFPPPLDNQAVIPYLPPPPEPIFKPIPEHRTKLPKLTKVHVPVIHTVKRAFAGLLAILNFAVCQFVLGWGASAQIFAIVFLGNTFLMIDYLWRTRHFSDPFKKVKI